MNSHNGAAKVRKLSPRPPLQATRLLAQLRERLRYLHYSLRTEQAYVSWVRHFVHFHSLRHPREMGQAEVEAFLDRTALSLYLLLRGDVWETVAAHTAQPDRAQTLEDRRPRYLHTVNAVMAGVDRAYLADALTTRLADQMLDAFNQRLAA